jgi:hypothetical protein
MLLRTKSLYGITGIMAVLVVVLIFFTQCTIELPTKEKEEEKPVEEVPLPKEEIPFSFEYKEHLIMFGGKEPWIFAGYTIRVLEGLTYVENRRFNLATNQPHLDLSNKSLNFIPEVGVSYSYGASYEGLKNVVIDIDLFGLEPIYWFELREGDKVYLRIDPTGDGM